MSSGRAGEGHRESSLGFHFCTGGVEGENDRKTKERLRGTRNGTERKEGRKRRKVPLTYFIPIMNERYALHAL